jgi:hypothetical protein
MTCPAIDELVAGGADEHAAGCDDCRTILELVAARSVAGCGRAEALMAARAAGRLGSDSGRLLALHLDSCPSCTLVADSLDAPEIADTLASAAALDDSLDGPALVLDPRGEPGDGGPPGEPVHGAPVPRDSSPASSHRLRHRRRRHHTGASPHLGRQRIVVAVIALAAIAVTAAIVTRALG